MAFQLGNTESQKANHRQPKLFRDALLVELKQADGDVERLQKVARRLVENAVGGETAAIREIADRIDGKVPQAHGGDDDMPAIRTVNEVIYTIVDPKSPRAEGVQSPAEPGAV